MIGAACAIVAVGAFFWCCPTSSLRDPAPRDDEHGKASAAPDCQSATRSGAVHCVAHREDAQLAAHLPPAFRCCPTSRPPSRRQRPARPTRPQALRALPVRSARYGDPRRRNGPSRHRTLSGLHRHPHAQEPPRRDPRSNHLRDRANTPGPLSPKDGETVTPPTAVRYTVTGYTLGQASGHIVAFVGGLTDRISIDLQAGNEPGLAYLTR